MKRFQIVILTIMLASLSACATNSLPSSSTESSVSISVSNPQDFLSELEDMETSQILEELKISDGGFTFLEISFQKQKSAEDSSRKNGKNPRRISFIVLALFRLCLFPLQKTFLHFSELSSTPASHLVPYGSLGMLLSSFSEVQRIRCSSPWLLAAFSIFSL